MLRSVVRLHLAPLRGVATPQAELGERAGRLPAPHARPGLPAAPSLRAGVDVRGRDYRQQALRRPGVLFLGGAPVDFRSITQGVHMSHMPTELGKVVGRCHKCDRPVRTGSVEGRLGCEGCMLPTDNCTCAPEV